jgi:hypothetical protein
MQKSHRNQASPLAIRSLGLLSCLVLLCLTGCQTMNVKAPFPWDKEKEKPQPDKIMAVWTDAVRTESGKPAERGFGGRIFFYDDKGKTMKVEGTVHIYVFDDDRTIDQVQIPEKKFVFPADSLELRYSKCSLGHSYNFWVPIGSVQGPNRNLSLVTKIELKSGGSVVSTVTRKILPGNGIPNAVTASKPKPSQPLESSPSNQTSGSVAQVSYNEPLAADAPKANSSNARQITAETIQLTPSFTQRLRQLSAEEKAPLPPATSAESPAASRENPETNKEQPESSTSPPRNGPAIDSELQKSQAQNRPLAQPNATTLRHQPHPAGWLSALPPTPRSGFQNVRPRIDPNSAQQLRRAAALAQAQAETQAQVAGNVTYSDGAAAQGD